MEKFRRQLPVRRNNPTKSPTGNNWSHHKPDLKEDFNSSCGYCDSNDCYRHTYFEVDHFVPKDFFKDRGHITLTQYSNLVYACKFCNNAKLAKWPSQDEFTFNDGSVGFVDPCDPQYESHFYRDQDGSIIWKTDLGKWMAQEAFQFDLRQASIKVLWNLNRLDEIIHVLKNHLEKAIDGSERHQKIKQKVGELAFEYWVYIKELQNFYNR